MIWFFRHPVKWVHVCWGPAKWGEPRRDPWNLWDLGIWAFPSGNSSKCIIGKKSSWKWRRDLRVQGRERSETDAMCGGKLVYLFRCSQKNVTGDIKKWKIRNSIIIQKPLVHFLLCLGRKIELQTSDLTQGCGLLVPPTVGEEDLQLPPLRQEWDQRRIWLPAWETLQLLTDKKKGQKEGAEEGERGQDILKVLSRLEPGWVSQSWKTKGCNLLKMLRGGAPGLLSR